MTRRWSPAFALVIALPVLAQSKAASTTTFSVEVKASAAEQFRYASSIMKHARELGIGPEEAVIQQAAALELIPQRWPNERGYALAAYQQSVQLLARKYPLNAIEVAKRAETYARDEPEIALIRADEAAALLSVGRTTEAENAFRAATEGAAFAKLDATRRRVVLKKAAFFFERQKRYGDAAEFTRRAATMATGSLDAVFDAEKAVELSFAAGDLKAARADLDTLVRELARARSRTLTAAEQAQLPEVDRYIDLYRRKIGR